MSSYKTWSLETLEFRLEELESEAEKIRKEIYRRLGIKKEQSK